MKGYTLTILCSRDEPELEQRMVEEAIARCADGVFLIPSKGSELSIARLQEAKIPFVLLFRATEQALPTASSVMMKTAPTLPHVI